MTMDGMSELMRDRGDITKLTSEVQEDKRLISLSIARERSSSLPCSWEHIDAFLFDHALRVFIEIRVEIPHDREMQVICLFEGEIFI